MGNKYRIRNKEQKKNSGRKKKKDCDINLDLLSCTQKQPKIEQLEQPKLENAVPPILGTVPLSLPSTTYIMPPLFATAPGMNMIQIDGNKDATELSLPLLAASNSNNSKKRKRMRECS